MKDAPLNRILLIAVIILAIGEGYLLVQVSSRPSAAQPQNMAVPSSASSTSPVVAQAPTNILVPLGGVVKNVSGSTITVSEQNSSVDVSVSGNTTIVQEGQLKDAATYEADLQKFQQESAQLMQDPQQNQTALEDLIAPSRNVETTIPLSQISVGEQISVFANAQSASGVYQAFRIQVTPAQQ